MVKNDFFKNIFYIIDNARGVVSYGGKGLKGLFPPFVLVPDSIIYSHCSPWPVFAAGQTVLRDPKKKRILARGSWARERAQREDRSAL